jgi:hypothetical protein
LIRAVGERGVVQRRSSGLVSPRHSVIMPSWSGVCETRIVGPSGAVASLVLPCRS